MPIFLDRHDMTGLSAGDIADAHRHDLEVQGKYGVKFLTYWFDEARGTGFCLIDAPDIKTAMRVHDEAHGDVAVDVIEVDLSAVEAFLGRVADPAPSTSGEAPEPDTAFRAVMFTDIVDSTGMTARLGDARSVEMVRSHDSIVRRALKDEGGREVKHTGDGIMASFDDVAAGVTCARAIQRAFDAFNLASAEKLRVRIGLHAGEPVEDSNDLFGATVQMAARICAQASPDAVVVCGVGFPTKSNWRTSEPICSRGSPSRLLFTRSPGVKAGPVRPPGSGRRRPWCPQSTHRRWSRRL